MKKQENAIELFRSGHNCAQSVLLSFTNELSIDKVTAKNIASGFGGGMGKLQKTCGALTGSFMVISLYNSKFIENEDERKKSTDQLIRSLDNDFIQRFGYSDCTGLIQTDLLSEEGKNKFHNENIKRRVCEKCITGCISWLEKNLRDKSL